MEAIAPVFKSYIADKLQQHITSSSISSQDRIPGANSPVVYSYTATTRGIGENVNLAADGPIILEPGTYYFHVEKENPQQTHAFLDTRVEPDLCMIRRFVPPFRRDIYTTCKVWTNMAVGGEGEWSLKIERQ